MLTWSGSPTPAAVNGGTADVDMAEAEHATIVPPSTRAQPVAQPRPVAVAQPSAPAQPQFGPPVVGGGNPQAASSCVARLRGAF